MSELLLVLLLNYLGTYVRYLFFYIINKALNRKPKKLSYYLYGTHNEKINNSIKDYINSVVGFIAFMIIVIFLYFIL